MTESHSFFGDPKVIISLLALLISGVSLIWTFANQWEQNRKWDKLNEGNPEIWEITFQNWKEFTKEQAMNMQWGYDPLLFERGEATEKYVIPYCLVLRDANTNERIPNSNPVFTIPEAELEMRRIGFNGNVILYRLFKPRFGIENMGKTELRDLSVFIEAKLPGKEWERVFTSNAKINLTASQKSNVTFNIELPLASILPEQISFKINFSFIDYKNKRKEKIIGAKWTSNDNYWSYETISE